MAFNTADFPASSKLDAWRSHISLFFDTEHDQTATGGIPSYAAHQTVASLQGLLIGETAAPEQVFTRTAGRIAADGLDHFLVQVFTSGGGAMPDRSVAHGDMLVIDMGQPHFMLNHAFAHITVVIPRSTDPVLTRMLERLHGRVLSQRNPQVRLLARHIGAVWAAMPDLTETDAKTVGKGVLGLMTLSLSDEADQTSKIHSDVAAPLKQAMVMYLEERLAQQVTVAEMMQRFNVSRAMLYRMFAPEGGLHSHVRARRLALAFRALSDLRNDHMGIGEIAFACGFQSDAHFARLFRQQFGTRPSDVRNVRKRPPSAPGPPDTPSDLQDKTSRQRQVLEQWLAALPGHDFRPL